MCLQGEDGLPGIQGPPALLGLEVRTKQLLILFQTSSDVKCHR